MRCLQCWACVCWQLHTPAQSQAHVGAMAGSSRLRGAIDEYTFKAHATRAGLGHQWPPTPMIASKHGVIACRQPHGVVPPQAVCRHGALKALHLPRLQGRVMCGCGRSELSCTQPWLPHYAPRQKNKSLQLARKPIASWWLAPPRIPCPLHCIHPPLPQKAALPPCGADPRLSRGCWHGW